SGPRSGTKCKTKPKSEIADTEKMINLMKCQFIRYFLFRGNTLRNRLSGAWRGCSEQLGQLGTAAEKPLQGRGRKAVDLAVPRRDHARELEHLHELLAGVGFGRVVRARLADAVFQQRDGRVHLAALALGHDHPERLHDVLERLEPVAAVADDMHAAD